MDKLMEILDVAGALVVGIPCNPKNADFIRLSTVHKCKGREAKDVYVLASTFRKGLDFVAGEEEENCVRGVVLSRHKENLFLVSGLPREED